MSEEKGTPLVPEGTKLPEEIKNEGNAALLVAIESLRKREREAVRNELASAIQELETPNRDAVPELYRQPAEHRGVTRFSSPTEPLYRRMSEEEREWRNPDSDFWVTEWLRGKYANDHGKMLLASAKCEEMFPRAVMAEGAADAAGGVAAGSGAELVPRPLEAVVFINRDRVAKMRRFATIYQMTAQEHNVPTAAAMTAYMASESTEATQGEPAVAQVPLVCHEAVVQARATKVLMADAAINVVTILSQRGGSALGVLEDNEFFKTGTGSAPHVSKLLATAYVLTTPTELRYTDVLGIYHTCPQQYRDNSVWFIESGVLEMLGNVRDGNGRPFYQGLQETPGPISDDPGAVGTILRKPVYEVPLTAGDVWFGDPSQYAIGNRQGITMEVSEHIRFLEREVVWMITERIAGNNTDLAAAQYTTGITSASSL